MVPSALQEAWDSQTQMGLAALNRKICIGALRTWERCHSYLMGWVSAFWTASSPDNSKGFPLHLFI